jgi:acyl-CoA reductase-like NAD-dependent aldehyde dehydrogenase
MPGENARISRASSSSRRSCAACHAATPSSEELFLPFVTVTRVGSLDEALAEANAPAYGLTAGIYSEDESEKERFLDEIEAGVVCVNRRAGATTGAWPGTQTFCGWKSSGSTGKGGLGPWYLPQFMREQSRTIARGPASAQPCSELPGSQERRGRESGNAVGVAVALP